MIKPNEMQIKCPECGQLWINSTDTMTLCPNCEDAGLRQCECEVVFDFTSKGFEEGYCNDCYEDIYE